MRFRLRSPVTVAFAIVAAGIAGGTSVYLAGDRIGEQDRRAIVGWEPEVAELIAEPRARYLALPDLADRAGEPSIRAELIAARRTFQDARHALPSVPTPRILYEPTISFTAFVGRTLEAIVQIERAHRDGPRAMDRRERARFEALIAEAGAHYARGREATIRLRCAARLDACRSTTIPG